MCNPSFGVVKPAQSSGVIPVGPVGFRVAKDVYTADSVIDNQAPADVDVTVTKTVRKSPKMRDGQSVPLTTYFRPSTPPVHKSATPVGGLTCYDTPFGMVTHPTGHVSLSNGHVVIRNAAPLSHGVPSEVPCVETKAARVITASATEPVVNNAGKRLGARLGVAADVPGVDYVSSTLTSASTTSGAPSLRKPFKKPRLLGANSV